MSLLKVAGATSAANSKLYVDDVFSTYLYTGNGSTQTITNGIDLAGKDGMVWIKGRTNEPGSNNHHVLFDTKRGAGKSLYTDLTNVEGSEYGGQSFNSNGFSIPGEGQYSSINSNYNGGISYVSWTFRKAAKFFDVQTFTYPLSGSITVNHSLGITPGCIFVKATDAADNWYVYHRMMNNGTNPSYYYMLLNTTGAQVYNYASWITVDSTSITFPSGALNPGSNFVMYLFAHDTSSTGIIQCGSYTSNGNSIDVNLGWEPQFVLVKEVSTVGRDWCIIDNMRGMLSGQSQPNAGPVLFPNTSNAELGASLTSGPAITSTGFNVVYSTSNFNYPSGKTYVYMAIRRPNKPPTSASQVFSPSFASSSGAFTAVSNFPPDLNFYGAKGSTDKWFWFTRLIGASYLRSSTTAAEQATGITVNYTNTNFNMPAVTGDYSTYINYMFARAPGFMDVVCYTGTGTTPLTINHSLGVVPEFIITKNRTGTGYQSTWYCYHAYLSSPLNKSPALNESAAIGTNSDAWRNITSTTFAFGSGLQGFGNVSGVYGVSYLFATLAGISKVGSYTGNGGTQNIDCGFGSKYSAFVLIKRTDSTGDWYIWDTARGITTDTEPHLSLNTTAAEVSSDNSVDLSSGGFVVIQNSTTNINVTSATYIYLSIASDTYSTGGEAVFTTPGTTTWTAPAGVTSVSIVAIGAGSAGGSSPISGGAAGGATGGGGGGLAYINNYTVIPGQSYGVVVGTRGNTYTTYQQYLDGVGQGGPTYFTYLGNDIIRATAGVQGREYSNSGNPSPNPAPIGGTWSGITGTVGYNGGQGGGMAPGGGGGGGGVGGYTGPGGAGGTSTGQVVIPLSGGAGSNGGAGAQGGQGGGLSTALDPGIGGSGGGGIGLFGSIDYSVSARGGETNTAMGGGGSQFGGYGGGGGGHGTTRDSGGGAIAGLGGAGGNGAVRIIWGPGRAFPNAAA